jgi:hypothetical protein
MSHYDDIWSRDQPRDEKRDHKFSKMSSWYV